MGAKVVLNLRLRVRRWHGSELRFDVQVGRFAPRRLGARTLDRRAGLVGRCVAQRDYAVGVCFGFEELEWDLVGAVLEQVVSGAHNDRVDV